MEHRKLNIIFVGAFKQHAGDGALGGQLYACRSLLKSPISEYVNWITIDSTMDSLPPSPLFRRFFRAAKRLTKFLSITMRQPIDGALIFTSSGLSFVEKGLMAILGCLFEYKIAIFPRDGFMLEHLEGSRFLRWYVPFVLRRCNYIVCQGEYWEKFYQSITALPASSFVVIKNWINVDLYAAPALSQENMTVTVLFMGWVEQFKGIYDLIEAVDRYRSGLSNTYFVICGRGSELSNARNRVTELGLSSWFDFRGWVQGKEKLAVLQKADIFVLPSYIEGMPNALLEAMAAGRAVIAAQVGGVPDLIVNESMGILFDPGDVSAFGKAIVTLRHNPELRRSLGENAQKHIQEHHEIDKVWSQIYRLFEQSVGC